MACILTYHPSRGTAFPGGKKGTGGEEERWQRLISTGESGIIPRDAPLYIDAPPEFPTGLLHASTLVDSFLAHLWNEELCTPLSCALSVLCLTRKCLVHSKCSANASWLMELMS